MPQFESDYEAKLYHDRAASLDKLAALGEKLGLTRAEATYPNSFAFTHTLPRLRALGEPLSAEQLEAAPVEAAIAGRLMAIRVQGKAGFATLQQEGQRLQLYVRKDSLNPDPEISETLFELYKLLQIGDIIGARGTLMRTRTGELTLKIHSIHLPGQQDKLALQLLTKAMLALPDKYHGLEDVELRYRQRYVDLIMNSGALARSEAAPSPPNAAVPAHAAILATDAAIPPHAVILSETESASTIKSAVILSAAKDPRISPAAQQISQDAIPAPSTNAILPTDAVILSAAKDPRISPAAQQISQDAIPAPSTNAILPTDAVILSAAKDPRISPAAPPHPSEPELTRLPVREVFVKRAAILRSIRKFFDNKNYLEVETPMLHTIAGGAAARPFKTHHNALDIPLSLRIAPELFLKRLVVGGLDRVYEINRNFRNEGVSTQHNPEFTMLEFYQAYANYHELMDLTEELVTTVATEVNGTTITHFNGHEIDLGKWQKLSMREAIIRFWPREFGNAPRNSSFSKRSELREDLVQAIAAIPSCDDAARRIEIDRIANALNIASIELLAREEDDPLGKTIADIFETVAETELIQPTIIYDFPLAVSPLSKVKPDEPDWVERFEFYIGGFEVGNAFSELNDPDDQRRRFEAQLEDRKRGDIEAMAEVDEDYVRALGYGLPPTAGEGIGIDRLTMILTGSRSIRDVILFPLLRPHAPADPTE